MVVLILYDGGFVAVDGQAVFAGLQIGFAEFRVLRNVDGLG